MSIKISLGTLVILLIGFSLKSGCQIASSPLVTPFAEAINLQNPFPEYPRPQLQRDKWMNLNGSWDYTLKSVDFVPVQGLTTKSSWTTGEIPTAWSGKIVVPFAIDAPLSGVGHILRHNEVVWYQRSFSIPSSWSGENVLVHFEASDWETSVYINGTRIGQHRGGYDPFTFDISSWLKKGENQIQVCVWDATENQCQAIGKQIMPENRQGFRYQPTGGIWKSVWLEPVTANSIENLKITPDFDGSSLKVQVKTRSSFGNIEAQVWKEGKMVAKKSGISGAEFEIPMKNFEAWSPSNPILYDLKITVKTGSAVEDEVKSYFGMRKIEVKKGPDGFQRIFLNNKVIFQCGPLDQGYWPDGVLTPPSEDAIKFDLNYLKSIGCNMVRVHIKTHPDRWYYQADRLGLLVWQDVVCLPKYGQTIDEAAAGQWFTEFKAMVDWLHNHPSIIMWDVFNEAWGQHNTPFYTNWIKKYDPSRLINCASGWDNFPEGDIMDVHDYTFYPSNNAADFKQNGKRALVIGEAGGLNLAIPDHTWYSEKNKPALKRMENYVPADNYNFKEESQRHTYGSPAVFEEGYRKFIESIRCLNSGSGCNAVVYTQISDVEHELNGYLTYDRKVSKINPQTLRTINEGLYSPPKFETVIPLSAEWKTADGKSVRLPAGSKNTLIPVTTEMSAPFEVTRKFNLGSLPKKMAVAIRGINNCEIRINGELFRKTKITARSDEPGTEFFPVFDNEIGIFKNGENIIKVSVEKGSKFDLVDIAVYTYN